MKNGAVVLLLVLMTLIPAIVYAELLYDTNESDKQSPLTGNFDITTNYVYQGLSNTNNVPAFQGGLTYTFLSTGIYLNTWGSNVNFETFNGHQATVEIDAIAGITHTIGDNFAYNFYIDRYYYPKAADANYTDIFSVFTYKIFTLTLDYSYDVYASQKSGLYVSGAINYPIPQKYSHFSDMTAIASIGHYFLPETNGLISYSDCMLGIQKKFGDYTATVQWTDTSEQNNYAPLGGNHIVGTLQYDF